MSETTVCGRGRGRRGSLGAKIETTESKWFRWKYFSLPALPQSVCKTLWNGNYYCWLVSVSSGGREKRGCVSRTILQKSSRDNLLWENRAEWRWWRNKRFSIQVRLGRLKSTFTPALRWAVELKPGAFPPLNLLLFRELREPQRNATKTPLKLKKRTLLPARSQGSAFKGLLREEQATKLQL